MRKISNRTILHELPKDKPQVDPLTPKTKVILALIQGLLPALSTVIAGSWIAYTYFDHLEQERLDRDQRAAREEATRLFEAQKPFNQKQLELYAETAQVVGRLVSTDVDELGKDKWKKDVQRFEQLYWTELSMVEDQQVKEAMQDFRRRLHELIKSPQSDEGQRGELRQSSYRLATALNGSIYARWLVRARPSN